ncbi:MAG: hypothetical protein M3Q56_11425 [Bacteroidota bacterium]|nr:hypothetical protein [Bacteroidota bacterium]
MSKIYLKALKWLADTVIPDKWNGYKTILANFVGMSIGLFEMLSDGVLFGILCTAIPFFCTITQAGFYVGLMTFLNVLSQILNGKRASIKYEKDKRFKELNEGLN